MSPRGPTEVSVIITTRTAHSEVLIVSSTGYDVADVLLLERARAEARRRPGRLRGGWLAQLGFYPIATSEKQLPNIIGNLV